MVQYQSSYVGTVEIFDTETKNIASSDPVSTARFIPVTVTELAAPLAPVSLVIHVGPASITLQKGFDPQLLRKAVEALSPSC